MKKYLVANWKMNPVDLQEAENILSGYLEINLQSDIELVVCPPRIFLRNLIEKSGGKFFWGTQNCFWEDIGAYTGEVSVLQVKKLGAKYVIVGHSERREFLGETDEMVNKKMKAVFLQKLVPILCIGGGKEAKNKKADALKIVKGQLLSALHSLPARTIKNQEFLVTYEPPWALSTVSGNQSASAKKVAEVSYFIFKLLTKTYGHQVGKQIPILYGGSVNAENIQKFSKKLNLAGFLVGGASLNPKEFAKMVDLME